MSACKPVSAKPNPTIPCTKGDLGVAQNLHRAGNLSVTDVHTIVSEGQIIRQKLRDVVSPWRYDVKTCVLAIQGFSHQQLRNTLLRALQNFMHPVLLHASQVGKDRWESVLIFHLREGVIRRHFSNEPEAFAILDFGIFVQRLQSWLDRFCQSTNVVELVRWSDLATLTSIDRVNSGSHRFGNWHHERCARYVYEYLWRRNEVHREQQNSYVREHTQVDFTVGNMLQAAFDRNNLELELATLRSLLTQTISSVSTLHTLCAVHATVLHELRLASVQRNAETHSVPWPEGTAVDSRLTAALESHHTTMQTVANIRNALAPQPAAVIDLTSQIDDS